MGDGLGDLAFWGAIGVIGLALLNGPIGRAVAARLQGRKAAPPDEGRMRELEARVADLEQSQARLAEVEERLDFNERHAGQPARRGAARRGEANEGRLGQGRGRAVHGHRRADALDLRAAADCQGVGARARRPFRSGRTKKRPRSWPTSRPGSASSPICRPGWRSSRNGWNSPSGSWRLAARRINCRVGDDQEVAGPRCIRPIIHVGVTVALMVVVDSASMGPESDGVMATGGGGIAGRPGLPEDSSDAARMAEDQGDREHVQELERG